MSHHDDIEQIAQRARFHAAQNAVLMELIRMLIMNGVLDQHLVVSSYEQLSADLMKLGAVEGVQLADQYRDFAAGVERKPS